MLEPGTKYVRSCKAGQLERTDLVHPPVWPGGCRGLSGQRLPRRNLDCGSGHSRFGGDWQERQGERKRERSRKRENFWKLGPSDFFRQGSGATPRQIGKKDGR